MPERERRRRFDPDERFSLDAVPEDVLRRMLTAQDPPSAEDEPPEDDAT